MSVFSSVVEFINFHNIGDVITRQGLINYVSFPTSSIDVYRRKLTLMGFIQWCGDGQYKKLKDIPTFINSTLVVGFPKNGLNKETLDRLIKIKRITNQLKEQYEY